MKRNFFLFLLLFFITLTTSVIEVAKEINFSQVVHRVKAAAMANAKETLEEDYNKGYKLQDEDPPMIIHLALIR